MTHKRLNKELDKLAFDVGYLTRKADELTEDIKAEIGDRFIDLSQREKRKTVLEIVKVDETGFVAVDPDDPADANRWAGPRRFCFTPIAINAMEQRGDFEWLVKNGEAVSQIVAEPEAEIVEFHGASRVFVDDDIEAVITEFATA